MTPALSGLGIPAPMMVPMGGAHPSVLPPIIAAREPVRLVIWDLDEAFWRGTLSEEGAIEYVQAHHDIVLELARRGIMSSICSKNDFAAARTVLEQRGLWDTFVFPSIDWRPKGPRIAALLDAVQLRPATVLFIDDNPNNRAEAEAMVPGLQVADETCIADLLKSPLLRGKDDRKLTRLAQYKLMERRKRDERAAGADNTDFLRQCGIRVTIETDIASHIDRAIELINRTNQLNFTKFRLSDDKTQAREELMRQISQFGVQAGLVRVSDKYGDYGFCGFYASQGLAGANLLIQYCFSCRILGLGVESWLYQKLGRPAIPVQGEVATNLFDERQIDWIGWGGESRAAAPVIPEVRLRGGCELDVLGHYLRLDASKVVAETNYGRDGLFFRSDSSTNLLMASAGHDAEAAGELAALGFTADDRSSAFLAPAADGTVLVYSGWGDVKVPVYRHRTLDLEVGISVPDLTRWLPWAARWKPATVDGLGFREIDTFLRQSSPNPGIRARLQTVIEHIRAHYVGRPRLAEHDIKRNMREIFERIPCGARLFVILPHVRVRTLGIIMDSLDAIEYNACLREVAAAYPAVELIEMEHLVKSDSELLDAGHFDRLTYYRVYKEIVRRLQGKPAAAAHHGPRRGAPVQDDCALAA